MRGGRGVRLNPGTVRAIEYQRIIKVGVVALTMGRAFISALPSNYLFPLTIRRIESFPWTISSIFQQPFSLRNAMRALRGSDGPVAAIEKRSE